MRHLVGSFFLSRSPAGPGTGCGPAADLRPRDRRRPRHRPRIAAGRGAPRRHPRRQDRGHQRHAPQGQDRHRCQGPGGGAGFIDLHAHGQDDENYRLYAMDGVTTALELEVGTEDVPGWYAERAGKALVNYGASSSHVRRRMQVFKRPRGAFLPSGDGGHIAATPGADRGDQGAGRGGTGRGRARRRHGAAVHPGGDEVGSAGDLPDRGASARRRSSCTTAPSAPPSRAARVESFVEVIGRGSDHRGAAPHRAPQQHEPRRHARRRCRW